MTGSTRTDPGDQRERRKIGLGTWPDVVVAVAAILTLIGGIWGWQWLTGRNDAASGTAVVATPPAAGSTNAGSTNAGSTNAGTTAPPATTDGDPLSSITPISGRTVPLPADLDPARYPRAVAIGCPSNQTGETETVIRYQVFRRYRTLTAQVSGWSENKQPFRVQVQVVTNTIGRDGTPVHEPGEKRTPTVNAGAVRMLAAVTAAGDAGRAGTGADEIELHVACDQPHDVVILSDARLRA